MFNYELKAARKKKGLNQGELGENLGVSRQTVQKWESGDVVPNVKRWHELEKALGMPLGWVAHFVALDDKDAGFQGDTSTSEPQTAYRLSCFELKQVPIISWVNAGAWGDIVDTFEPGDADDWIMVTDKVSTAAFALKIIGDSMAPEFREGEIIIVDPDIQPDTGRYVIAKTENGGNENGEATFKQFIRDGNNIYLKPLNNQYKMMDMTDKDFTVVGCVVQKTKKY